MNKRILLSVMTIGVVLAMVGGATQALFSDTETSVGNTFSAGTIDISVNDQNPWSESVALTEMKPSYTDYINFTIRNVGSNPADIWKTLSNIVTDEGLWSEPECDAQGGTWEVDVCNNPAHSWHGIHTVIEYDLYVELYNASDKLIWHQMLYDKDILISDLPTKMYLGMIPSGWYMKVYQSYHMKGDTGNWAQGDTMTFDITLEAEQLTGSLVLEDKSGDPDWDIDQTSPEQGILTYEVMSPTFDFSFTGRAPSAGKEYALVIGDNPWDAGQLLGTDTADGSGNVDIPLTSVELGQSYDHAKVWLILSSDWTGAVGDAGHMTHWNGSEYLYETGLIEYRDL